MGTFTCFYGEEPSSHHHHQWISYHFALFLSSSFSFSPSSSSPPPLPIPLRHTTPWRLLIFRLDYNCMLVLFKEINSFLLLPAALYHHQPLPAIIIIINEREVKEYTRISTPFCSPPRILHWWSLTGWIWVLTGCLEHPNRAELNWTWALGLCNLSVWSVFIS